MNGENQKTILLVEDEALLALRETISLAGYNYKIVSADSGEDALSVIRTRDDIDLVLMDIDLGEGLDGTETARRILKDREIPIVFLSSHTDAEVLKKTDQITSYGYVVKNSGISVLDTSIKMAFRLFDANRKIEDSELKQKTMISHISDVIGIVDERGRIKYLSPNSETSFGWQSQDLVDTSAALTVHPDDRARIKKAFYGLLQEENAVTTVQYRYACKDSQYKPIELTAINLVHDPVINGVLFNYHDITGRKRAEEELRESEEKYRLLAENINDMISLHSTDGTYLYLSPSCASLLGYRSEELVGSHPSALFHPDDLESLRTASPSLLQLSDCSLVTYRVRRKDGTYIWLETNNRTIRDRLTKEAKQILCISRDISERKRFEGILAAKNEELDRYFLSVLDMLCIADRSGNFLRMNPEWERVLGYALEELSGSRILDFVHPDDMEASVAYLEKLQKQEVVTGFENRYRCKDGSYKWIEWRSQSQSELIFATARDITARKQAEEKILELLAEKELILKEVHHRIKNNMNTIKGLLSLQAGTLTDPASVMALEDAESRVQSMAVLYDNLYQSEDFNEISVAKYIPSLIDQIMANFPNRGAVKVFTHIDDFILSVKKLQPLGILVNELLTNIMKYAFIDRTDGRITVYASLRGSYVVVTITDNGNGIPESVSFENSTGFGLVLVKGLTKQLKGTIKMERGNGTVITLEFKR
jgi:PAS domain S-box-containing protein